MSAARDELELRMPRLPGVDQEAVVLDRVGEPGERRAHHRVVGKELVEPGDDADRRTRRDRCETRAIERVAALERGNAVEPTCTDQRVALLDVPLAVVAQQDRVGLLRPCAIASST